MIPKKYQLTVTVAKAHGLARCEEGGVGIKPFVSARAFGCVLTTGKKSGTKPVYSSKLQFPIHYPILNDKITMRIWHREDWKANVFLANIPEHPSATDYFNISKLLA